jgi:hypothetical protein
MWDMVGDEKWTVKRVVGGEIEGLQLVARNLVVVLFHLSACAQTLRDNYNGVFRLLVPSK